MRSQPKRPAMTAEQAKRDLAIKQKARDATLTVGPRVTRITGIPDGPIKLNLTGCQGENNPSQKQTAKLMNDTLVAMKARGEPLPILTIYDGDNIYPRGTHDPLDTKFNTYHHDIYYDAELTELNKIASSIAMGNHDENYDEIAKIPAALNIVSQGEVVGINQTAHNYLDESCDSEDLDWDTLLDRREKMIDERIQLFMQPEVHISQLGKWEFSYYFRSLILGKTQLFFLNTNDLLKHFLLSATKQTRDGFNHPDSPTERRVNQFEWLMTHFPVALAAGLETIFVQHIPPVVCGKRSFKKKYDTSHFLTSAELQEINAQLKQLNPEHIYTDSYNELIVCLYRQFKLMPNLFVCAHEHFLSYLNEYKLPDGALLPPQFTTGGGGGKLQHRESFRNHPFVGMQQSHHGFGILECNRPDGKSFLIDVFTLEGLHMRFNAESCKPVVEIIPCDNMRELHLAVQEACHEFMLRLKDKELRPANPDNGYLAWTFGAMAMVATTAVDLYKEDPEARKRDHEIENLQDLQAYFNQRKLPDFETALNWLKETTDRLPHHKSSHLPFPLYVILDNEIKKRFNKSITELFEDNGILKRNSLSM